MLFDPNELQWLKDNPAFEERPATVAEFLGPDYLNIESTIRRRIKAELVEIMGEKVSGERPTVYPEAAITGGIGIGKTTVASIVLTYLAHWTLCLRDPQAFFNLMPGSRIAFMQMSTSEKQAIEVVFGDIKARIAHSPWFQNHPYNTKFTKQLRFPKDIWIIPGDSQETTFEGYNILGGILDEGDSHKVTTKKDYAEEGYTTISSRISSRFQDRGFLLCIGQMKRSTGFMARKFREFRAEDNRYAVRLAIWDALDEEKFHNSHGEVEYFTYDVQRKQVVPNGLEDTVGISEAFIKIPVVYLPEFRKDPQKALRDLAGIPPAVNDPFIAMTHKIEGARDRWLARPRPVGAGQSPVRADGQTIENWFEAPNTLPRSGHIDIAYAGGGDALGFAMGHVPRMVEVDGESKPYIEIDMLARIVAPPGGQIILSDVRRMIYNLRDQRGFRLNTVTLDGFESTDTMQQLARKRIKTEYLSVDREVGPYHDLREAIYDDRIEWPEFVVDIRDGTGISKPVEILFKELSELMDTGRKIDHPIDGSKDVADAVAGVAFTLMSDRRLQRRTVRFSDDQQGTPSNPATLERSHHAVRDDFSLSAPLPPRFGDHK